MAQKKMIQMVAFPGQSTTVPTEIMVDVPHTHDAGDIMCEACIIESTACENLDELDKLLEQANAEGTGTGAGEGSSVQGTDGEAKGRLHLRNDAQDGLDAGASEGSGENAEQRPTRDRVEYESFDVAAPPEGVLQHTDFPNPFPKGHPVEILIGKEELEKKPKRKK